MSKQYYFKKLGSFAGPFLLLCFAVAFAGATADDVVSTIRLFDLVALTVSDRYVDPIAPETITRAGVDGLMEKLDPYSQFLAGGDYDYLIQETHGEYVGIGVQLDNKADTLRISGVIYGSPAMASDIRIGDRILAIDSINAIGLSRSECLRHFRGKEGTKIKIKIWRPIDNSESIKEPQRTKMSQESLVYHELDSTGVGYIKCVKFSDGCAAKMKDLISQMKSNGLRGLILDLRDNPGGLLYEAVEVAALFLHKGDKIVATRGRTYGNSRNYEANQDGIYTDSPLVVVINGMTASAAEIVAGAIQDHDRGLIVGQTSYGKGLVQQIFQLSDDAALKLTTAKYYTPSDRCINRDSLSDNSLSHHSYTETRAYFTRAGRNVFGGGGIIPDIYVEESGNSSIVNALLSDGYFSDFVKSYSADKIIGENFKVTDEIYELFRAYLDHKGFRHQNRLDKKFTEFIENDRSIENDKRLASHIGEISKILQNRSRTEVDANKTNICAALYERFIDERLGQNAVVRLVSLRYDPELKKAREILLQPRLYSSYLAN